MQLRHRLSLAFVPEDVQVFETAEELVAALDSPEPQPVNDEQDDTVTFSVLDNPIRNLRLTQDHPLHLLNFRLEDSVQLVGERVVIAINSGQAMGKSLINGEGN